MLNDNGQLISQDGLGPQSIFTQHTSGMKDRVSSLSNPHETTQHTVPSGLGSHGNNTQRFSLARHLRHSLQCRDDSGPKAFSPNFRSRIDRRGEMPSSMMSHTMNVDSMLPSDGAREYVRVQGLHSQITEEEPPSVLASRLYDRLGYRTPMYQTTDRYHSALSGHQTISIENPMSVGS